MPRIPSPNADFQRVTVPGNDPGYYHPVDNRPTSRPIPMAFQVTSPFDHHRVLLPHALVLHVNPISLQESNNQKIERFQTRGGFVEQHWGHELIEISADASTGAFMNIRTGLTSVLRQRTIAWDRFRDLHDLFRNNGSVYNPLGDIVLQGDIMLMYDRGTFLGTFRTFEWEESADTPFSFTLNWSFKVHHTVMSIDTAGGVFAGSGLDEYLAPEFQAINTQGTSPEDAGSLRELTIIQQQQAFQQGATGTAETPSPEATLIEAGT